MYKNIKNVILTLYACGGSAYYYYYSSARPLRRQRHILQLPENRHKFQIVFFFATRVHSKKKRSFIFSSANCTRSNSFSYSTRRLCVFNAFFLFKFFSRGNRKSGKRLFRCYTLPLAAAAVAATTRRSSAVPPARALYYTYIYIYAPLTIPQALTQPPQTGAIKTKLKREYHGTKN